MDPLDKDKAAFFWLTQAWDDYLASLGTLLPVLLVQYLFSAGTFYLVSRFHSFVPAFLYMLFVVTPLTTGSTLVYIHLTRGDKARFLDLFSAFPVYHRALAVSVGVGLLTFGGLLMFVIPGLVLYLTFCFSEYAVVDRGTGIKDSFNLSRDITEGWKSRLMVIFSLVLLVNMLTPDIISLSGTLKEPVVKVDLKGWFIAGAALKTFVFLPWLNLAMARAYNLLLILPKELPAEEAGGAQ